MPDADATDDKIASSAESAEQAQAPVDITGPTLDDCRWAVANLATNDGDLSEPPSPTAQSLLIHARRDASILRMLLDRTLPKLKKETADVRDEMLDLTSIEDQMLKEFGELTFIIKYAAAHPEVIPQMKKLCA